MQSCVVLAAGRTGVPAAKGGPEGTWTSFAASPPRRVDPAALERARACLAERRAIVRSAELEAVTELNRYELARQFRAAYGTSPYRYSLMRRLDFARARLGREMSLAALAVAASPARRTSRACSERPST